MVARYASKLASYPCLDFLGYYPAYSSLLVDFALIPCDVLSFLLGIWNCCI